MLQKKNFPLKGLGSLIKGGWGVGGSADSPYQSDSLLVGVCVPKSVRGEHCNHGDDDGCQDNHCGNDYDHFHNHIL